MDALALNDAQSPTRPGLSPAAIFGIVVLAAFTFLITWRAGVLESTLKEQDEQPALVSKLAPDFSAPTLDGRIVSLADFRGQKKVVVAFWASWCGPCRMEMPSLVQFYKANHNDSSDFEILAVSIDDEPRDATNFATAQKLNFPVLFDPRQKMASAYEVEGIPTMYVIDKDGKIIFGRSGYDPAMEFQLARELGIKQKQGELIQFRKQTGAADGDASH
jgi:peroxiredoxin